MGSIWFSLKSMGEIISPSSSDDYLMVPFANISFLFTSDATVANFLVANWFGL